MGVQRNRTLLNVGLLLLLVALAGAAWWQSQQKTDGAVLLALDRSQITRLTIERNLSDEQPELLVFERKAGKWVMLQPQAGDADETRIAHLMTLLGERVENRYSSQGQDLTQFELQPGHVRVTFNDQALVLGMSNPVSQHRYVLHAGDIKLVNETVFGALQDDVPTFLVKPSPLPVSTE